MVTQAPEYDFAIPDVDSPPQAAAHRLWLFKDFLEHVMGMITEFDLVEAHFELPQLRGHFNVVEVRRMECVPCNRRDDLFVQIRHAARMRHDRLRVGCHDVAAVTHTDQQGRAPTRSDKDIRLLTADDGNCVRAFDFPKGGSNRCGKIAFVEFSDQVRQHFGICF